MSARSLVMVMTTAVVLLGAVPVLAGEIELEQVTFLERRSVTLPFAATPRAPAAQVQAEVEIRDGQARIEITYERMKPAILYGGDVTCYVLWAVTRDGTAENLGELWVRSDRDKVKFSSGQKSFALMVTAETYPLVTSPSELVIFTSGAPSNDRAPAARFVYAGLAPAPRFGMDSIAPIAWDSSTPLDLLQAEKALELAQREGVEEHAPDLYSEASVALAQARNLATRSSRDKTMIDYSRRVVALAAEGIQITRRRLESEELARQIATRRAEMEALGARAAEAEATVAATQAEILETQAQVSALAAEKAALGAEKEALLGERAALQAEQHRLQEEQAGLAASVTALQERAEILRAEREEVAARLEDVLSKVAETRDSARGLIVNLPDILFDLNEASLKQEARVVLAKLAGVLLVMPQLNLRIEGHTDATGSDEYNQTLSERRAGSVQVFLSEQGIEPARITAVGYGKTRPVADNETASGRQKNRRVEIVIGEGVVAEEAAPGTAP